MNADRGGQSVHFSFSFESDAVELFGVHVSEVAFAGYFVHGDGP